MTRLSGELLLRMYEHEAEADAEPGERLFRIILLCSFLIFGSIGWYLVTHDHRQGLYAGKIDNIRRVSFILDEEKNKTAARIVSPVLNDKKEKAAAMPAEPVDLSGRPLLGQAVGDVRPDNAEAALDDTARSVFGLRKVYSTGIGAEGTAAEAVVGKLGNTLNTDIDTFTATEKDLKSRMSPATAVYLKPRFKVKVKPEYTRSMVENGVQGVIRAKLLIDPVGKVKKVIVLDDLGFGTKQEVYETCWRFEFEPARTRNGNPLAAWITVRLKFALNQ